MVKDFFNPMSELVLVIIIYTTRHWTYIHIWAGVACLLPLPLYFIITESPRWLATNGKIKEAEDILTNIGLRNGKEITENQKIVIRKTLMNIQREANAGEGKEDLNPLIFGVRMHHRIKHEKENMSPHSFLHPCQPTFQKVGCSGGSRRHIW